jgi:hypothetical protein
LSRSSGQLIDGRSKIGDALENGAREPLLSLLGREVFDGIELGG